MDRKPKRQKTGGRQKGTPNKITVEMRVMLKDFLHEKWPQVRRAFDKLEPKDQLVAYTRLLAFIAPPYQSVSMSLHTMTESDLQTIVNHLKNNTIDIDPDEQA